MASDLASDWLASNQPENATPSRDSERGPAGNVSGSQTENSPTQSPWCTAPAGRPVAIPAFGRGLLEVLLDLLMPKPVLVPVKVRATTRRR
jgi:hypothetical protein